MDAGPRQRGRARGSGPLRGQVRLPERAAVDRPDVPRQPDDGGDKIYAFPDDGDVFILYYRKDIFNDAENQQAFKAKHGYDLAPPKTWKQFAEIGQFLTDKYAPKMYGAAFFRQAPYAMFMFEERFRNEGGRFFDADTMKATINSDVGVKVFTEMRAENKFMPPGVEQFGFVENLAAFLAGQTAMTISWPPYGRWAAGYGTDEKALDWVPKSTVAGKVGYALPPGGHPELAAGFCLSVASTSKQKDAAYLFIQWLNSNDISMQRVQLPYALRDPFRVDPLQGSRLRAALAGGEGISRHAKGRRPKRACSIYRCFRPTGTRKLSARRSPSSGGRRSEANPRRGSEAVGSDHRAHRRRPAEGRLQGVGSEIWSLSGKS